MTHYGRNHLVAVAALYFVATVTPACTPDDGVAREGVSPLSSKVQRLIRDAKSKKAKVREGARGQLICYLQRGMTRKQVEAWLGPPNQDGDKDRVVDGLGVATYYCKPPQRAGGAWMHIYYDLTETPRLLRVKGPDTPANPVDEEEPGLGLADADGVWNGLSPWSNKVQKLIRKTRDGKAKVRERAIGELLGYLQQGMTRHQVEAWLGQPDLRTDSPEPAKNVRMAVYYCVRPGTDQTVIMAVEFDKKAKPISLLRVTGPLKKLPAREDD